MYDAKAEANEFVGDDRSEAVSKACRFYGIAESELKIVVPEGGEIFGCGARSVVVAIPKNAKPPSPHSDSGDRGRGRDSERGRGSRGRGGDRGDRSPLVDHPGGSARPPLPGGRWNQCHRPVSRDVGPAHAGRVRLSSRRLVGARRHPGGSRQRCLIPMPGRDGFQASLGELRIQ